MIGDMQTENLQWRRWLVLLLGILLFAGCGGCVKEDQPQDPKEKETKNKPAKPDFENKPAVLYPGIFNQEIKSNRAKPGHWVQTALRSQANNYDANGEMLTTGMSSVSSVAEVPGTNCFVETRRLVAMPKEQPKTLESLVFIPCDENTSTKSVNVRFVINNQSQVPVVDTVQPVLPLKPYQYHFVVLVDAPDSYSYLKVLDCIKLPNLGSMSSPAFYHIVMPDAEGSLPLAPSALAWTTTAYVLWDGMDPERFTSEQKTAIIDWLHFGGQLIVSGPNSLETLQASFLGPYLPASSAAAINLSDKHLLELNENWSTNILKNPDRKWEFRVPTSAPMLGVKLELNDDAMFIKGTGELVAEKNLGRGRIVVTGFSLKDIRFKKWPNASSFIHNALMRRPVRKFYKAEFDNVGFRWSEGRYGSTFNPILGTNLRFLSRDLGGEVGVSRTHLSLWNDDVSSLGNSNVNPWFNSQNPLDGGFNIESSALDAQIDPWMFGGYGFNEQAGMGAWNDSFGVAEAARKNIVRVAGITPPSPKFVLQLLSIYLLVLVPVNWLIFKLMGRVEWAWIAMPIISLIGAVAVVKLASLDIGFVRSRTQIGILEMHDGYARGHLTQYSALYSSLSTRYQIEMNGRDSVALPFKSNSDSKSTLRPVVFETGIEANLLRNFLVTSNSTGMTHQETLMDLGGALRLIDGDNIQNDTNFDYLDAGVVRCLKPGQFEFALIGELVAGQKAQLDWQNASAAELYNYWYAQKDFQSIDATCREIWPSLFDKEVTLSNEQLFTEGVAKIEALLQHPELQGMNSDLIFALQRQTRQRGAALDIASLETNYERFVSAYAQASKQSQKGLGVGELFDVVTQELTLNDGEIRMFARTVAMNEQSTVAPNVTQEKSATLVVAHLRLPKASEPKPDENTLIDFIGKSDLFRKFEESLDTGEFDSETTEEDASDDQQNNENDIMSNSEKDGDQ